MNAKKTIFTLGAVSAVCACGLFIDPDKLIEGNNGTSPPIDAPSGDENQVVPPDGSQPDVDAGTDANEIIVVVPECVPAKPIQEATGPYAVVGAAANGPAPVCPKGYLPTPVDQGKSGFKADPAVCADTSGCTCTNTGSGTTCGLRIRSYDDNLCAGKEADSPTSVPASSCGDLDSEKYYKLEYVVGGVSCAPSGSATPSSKPAPVFDLQYVICAPDPAVTTAKCAGGDIPLPPANDASACILVPQSHTCAGTTYGGTIGVSKNGAFTDNRACTCGCQTSNNACTNGKATIYEGLTCSGTATVLDIGGCTPRDSQDTVKTTSTPTPGASACEKKATPTGEASANADLKLCCITAGGG